jgi:ComF family protein
VYPEQCVVCEEVLTLEERHLCSACRASLPWVGEPTCPRCGARVPFDVALRNGCAECWNRHFAFRRAVAPFRYDGSIRELVRRFKLGRQAWLAYLLGGLLCDFLATGEVSRAVDLVAPVPLHWRRRVQRGFNQAELLALEVGGRFGLPVIPRLLRRTRWTTTQTAFSHLRREANVRGAFVAWVARNGRRALPRLWDRWRGRADLRGKRVLLVDDVLTTGSTVHECARVLRNAGAQEVLVATVARATR